jgi:hypothetical protein
MILFNFLKIQLRIVLKKYKKLKEIQKIAIKHIQYNNNTKWLFKYHKNLILVPIERCSVV